ncbi:MAG: thiamine pyrophosphate-dependent dehydrogenase E1 component subunit alpha [Chloroflexota bacterium]|nr:thiamine pyrophosphate-dependent dehydrogenase E1 component subunit alpha [Chloroflexota bacterium]
MGTNDLDRPSGSPSSRLSESDLLDMLWTMLLCRRFDERAWLLHRQGKIVFHTSAMGHEAAQIGAIYALQRGVDYVCPYYRDLGMMVGLGWTARDLMLDAFAKHQSPSSAGRQMPNHFSDRARGVVSTSAPVTTQVVHAAGMAFAIKYKQRFGLADDSTPQPRLALASLGEGSTSQGDFHEALNWAGVHRLPMICLVENNGYAISVKQDAQMAITKISDRAAGYGICGVCIEDGMDLLAVYDAACEAAQRAYNGDGATLLEVKCYRLTPHSSDDDDRSYRTREEVELWKGRDPLNRFRDDLLRAGVLNQAAWAALDARARAEVDAAQAEVEALPEPPPEAAIGAVYASGEVSAWQS